MNETQERLLYLLHLALVEIRNLSVPERCRQAAQIADAVEYVPRLIGDWQELDLDILLTDLKRYQDDHPERPYDFVGIVTTKPLPENW